MDRAYVSNVRIQSWPETHGTPGDRLVIIFSARYVKTDANSSVETQHVVDVTPGSSPRIIVGEISRVTVEFKPVEFANLQEADVIVSALDRG